jgi:hypothetical protein
MTEPTTATLEPLPSYQATALISLVVAIPGDRGAAQATRAASVTPRVRGTLAGESKFRRGTQARAALCRGISEKLNARSRGPQSGESLRRKP